MPEYSEFSEFSYGYALVDNLARGGGWGGLAGAPRFISLLEEGSAGGGYDVALNFVARPLFLQFKIPQIMRRRSSGPKGMPPGFHTPYYRMHLRTERVNASGMTQHEQLMELERQNPLSVFYVTPRFHTSEELNEHYLNHRVHDETEWFPLSGFDPADPLTREPHRIAYGNAPGMCVVQSTPFLFKERMSFNAAADRLGVKLRDTAPSEPEVWLENLEHIMAAIIAGERVTWIDDFVGPPESGRPRRRFLSDGRKVEFYGRLRTLAKTVRTRLDAELILAMPSPLPNLNP